MIVKLDLKKRTCKVIREKGDIKYREHGGWGSGESQFYYHVKQNLQKQGYDVIKEDADKDHIFWIRSRKYLGNPDAFAIDYADYAIRFVYEDFNTDGEVDLRVLGHDDFVNEFVEAKILTAKKRRDPFKNRR